MKTLRLFTDGSVNPESKVGYGAYLVVSQEESYCESLKTNVKIKKFEQTSSTKLELQTLVWALNTIQGQGFKIVIFSDSQNIIGLLGRRARFEQNNYRSKKNKRIKNYRLYQDFFRIVDGLDCKFIKVRGHKASHSKDEIDKFFALVDKTSRKFLRRRENHVDQCQR